MNLLVQSRRRHSLHPLNQKHLSPKHFTDACFVGVLVLYLMAGVALVPFHGDESTIIYMARDGYQLVVNHDVQSVLFRDPPPDPHAATDQQLRLSNGVISKYGIGLASWLMGWPIGAINEQWMWGADWDYNARTGHFPNAQLLFVSRLSSAWMAALSVALVFAIGKRLVGRLTAWLATIIYGLMPAMLLNGRRAVFESATLLFTALLIWIALGVARRMQLGIVPWQGWLLLGLSGGLALASKHTAVIALVPVFVVLLIAGARSGTSTVFQTAGPSLLRTIGGLAVAAVVTLALFLLLNPAWWSAPLTVPREVLRLRQELLAGQVQAFGGYASTLDRVIAVVAAPFGPAQYYEVQVGWPTWIGGQIDAYQGSGLAGIGISSAVGVAVFPLVILLSVIGSVSLWTVRPALPGRLFCVYSVVTLAAIFMLTPVPWQRYYLPLALPWSVLCSAGISALISRLIGRLPVVRGQQRRTYA